MWNTIQEDLSCAYNTSCELFKINQVIAWDVKHLKKSPFEKMMLLMSLQLEIKLIN